jgi:hypothetical protein
VSFLLNNRMTGAAWAKRVDFGQPFFYIINSEEIISVRGSHV